MVHNAFKVKLRSQVTNTVVAFDVTPEITETRNVNYKTLEPVHMPGGIYVYGSTSARNYQVNNIRLVSRTAREAAKNLYRLNILRSWTMPYFGINNSSLTGAPPDVLALSAYATGSIDSANDQFAKAREDNSLGTNDMLPARPNARNRATNIQNVPVVLQQLSIPYPSDTDYIPTSAEIIQGVEISAGVPFPTIMTVDLVLMETHSPREYARFDLKKFRNGLLDTF